MAVPTMPGTDATRVSLSQGNSRARVLSPEVASPLDSRYKVMAKIL